MTPDGKLTSDEKAALMRAFVEALGEDAMEAPLDKVTDEQVSALNQVLIGRLPEK